MTRHDASISGEAACGFVAPGPLHGLQEVLNAFDGAPLHSVGLDSRDIYEHVCAAVELIGDACRDGERDGDRFTPSLPDRRKAILEAAALLAQAKRDLGSLRKALDVLVPALGIAAALVERQTGAPLE
jgi:hypothetical protein